jgi:hypothetical protein
MPYAAGTRRLLLASSLIVALLSTGCPFFDDPVVETPPEDEDAAVCGFDVLPSPASLGGNPCTDGELVFADTFTREAGAPIDETRSIDIPEHSRLCVTVDNGGFGLDGDDDKPHRASAGWVGVDGEPVSGPDRLSKQVDVIRHTFQAEPGTHDVSVRLASGPSAKLGVEVRALDPGASHNVTMGENGSLEVTNVAADHPLFSPNDDGYHDTTVFHADNFAHDLPGQETGEYDYAIDWQWQIIEADSCEPVDVILSGTEQVNSPANVTALWDGTLSNGDTVADGTYIYQYRAELVRSDGLVIDTAVADAHALLVDTREPDYGSTFETADGHCDPYVAEDHCECPDDLPAGTRCTFAWVSDLDSFEDPSSVDTSEFITTHFDQDSGDWEVVVDLREYNGGGLVPQGDGYFEDAQALRDYVSALTGVPADPEGVRLFNFEYVQLGYSTPVVDTGMVEGFNHFLLDAITDQDGAVTIGQTTFDLNAMLDAGETVVPDEFEIDAPRDGDECSFNGNSDGRTAVTAKSCSEIVTANLDPTGSNLGVYHLQSAVFDVEVDQKRTERDDVCIINGIYECGVRTFHRDADMRLASDLFVEDDGITLVGDAHTNVAQLPGLVVGTDRHFQGPEASTPIDGACARAAVQTGELAVPLDSAVGAVPSSCIINGIY